jgi:hypothetical protein
MNWLSIGLVAGFTALVTYILLRSIQQKNRLLAHGIRTLGTVTGQETNKDSENGITYCLQVQFTARNGRRYAGRSAWHRSPLPQEVGDTIPLLYEETNPYVFELEVELSQTKNYVLLVLTWAGAAYWLWTNY